LFLKGGKKGGETNLEIGNVLKDERIVDSNLATNSFVHSVYVGLVNGHTLLRERRCVVDRYVMELRMLAPILVCRKKIYQQISPLG